MTHRAYMIAEAAVEMIATNFQRGEYRTECVTRTVGAFSMMYESDGRMEPEPDIGVLGHDQSQRFGMTTERPLTGGDAEDIVEAVGLRTSHGLVADTDIDGKTWGFATEEGQA